MAQITYEDLYNQLTPTEKTAYEGMMGVGGFKKQYEANPNNIVLTSNPKYEKFKTLYEAEKAVPEKGFMAGMIDKINPFSSASATEMSQIPNLSLGYTMPTFDLATGITNTSGAKPFLKSMADIDTSGNVNTDLINRLIAESTAPVTSSVMYDEFPPGFSFRPQGLPLQNLGMDTSYGVANEPDVEQDVYSEKPKSFKDSKTLEEYFQNRSPLQGIEKLMSYLPFGENSIMGRLLRMGLPQESPEIKSIKNFYRSQDGLDPIGRVASGIMAGYNPVYGGALNMLTGGRFGKPTQFGLAGAMQKRIENILGRRAAQTDASRAKVEELRNLQLKEMQDRSDRGESLSSIGKSTFSGKGKAFEAKPSGAYSKGFAGGR